jgi:hypothetical protein
MLSDTAWVSQTAEIAQFISGQALRDALEVDGAYIATTDKRRSLRSVAEKLNLQLIDGADIQRIQNSPKVLYKDRISDEHLLQELQLVDREFRNKSLTESRLDILSALSEGFGASSAVRALEAFARLAATAVTCHPDSSAARAAGRLAYLAAAITCESLDYVSVGAAFRTLEERRELMLKAVRLGALSSEDGQQRLKLDLALIEKYGPGGRSAAIAVETGLKKELEGVPAEIVEDQAIRLLKGDQLFWTGRELEMESYHVALHPFDALSQQSKSMVGALLDYAGVDRQRFAQAWTAMPVSTAEETVAEVVEDGSLPV